jgi:hypothetical protein
MTCPICIAPYNKTVNFRVVCPDTTCGYEACKECVRTYLLGATQDPHCMNCRKAFDPEFITTNLNVSWMKSTYRDHRKKLLVEREISRIPDTMQFVENQRQIRTLTKDEEDCKKTIKDMQFNLNQMQNHKYTIQRDINTLKRGGNLDTEKKQFIMPCPDEGCRGFLSTGYKCGACAKFTCSKCHEIIGPNKTNTDHVCNEDSVKSAELIKKDTKPCPKCGERISKISGCDQMWCPTCQTAFSWKTGAIDMGVVHNPHFYQWQSAGGTVIRNPGDVACGGLSAWWPVRAPAAILISLLSENVQDEYSKILWRCVRETAACHQRINHIMHHIVDRLRTNLRENDANRDLRVSYILNEITKEQFSSTLVKNDNTRKKNTELLHIWELVQTVAIENINAYLNDLQTTISRYTLLLGKDPRKNLPLETINTYRIQFKGLYMEYHQKYQDQIIAIKDYANSRFAIISATFNCTAPKLCPELYEESTQKAKQSILKSTEPTSQKLYPNAEGAV